jgi:soluble lytic murein transglycosylase
MTVTHNHKLTTLLLALLLWGATSSAQTQELEQQRQTYRLAQLALKTQQMQVFEQLKAQLEAYPLYPYLVYADLKRRLGSASDVEIEAFLDGYADTPLADLMRGLWLYKLYQQDRWEKFLEVYDGRPVTELMCYDLRARIRVGRMDGVIEGAKKMWLVGGSQHSACDRLFEWFQTQPEFTADLVWARIELAMAAGNTGLAGYLGDKLDAGERTWVALWQQAHLDPRATLRDHSLDSDEALPRKIMIHAVLRLADRDVEQGKAAWERIRSAYDFEPQQRDAVGRSIALLAAYRHHPEAAAWLEELPTSARNDDVYTWQARAAIRESDWPALKQAIEGIQDTSEEPLMWKYWQARALEQTGDKAAARALYAEIADERDYYGFLAADRLGVGYSMNNEPLVEDAAAAGVLVDYPGIRRAYELLRLGEETEARREWNYVIGHLDRQQVKLAAVLASRWGWHADAIRTVALIGELDDLEVRFPVAHEDEVLQAAKLRDLDPAWIFGVIRRESAFAVNARSPAGALGLMQLMPGTASLVAQKIGVRAPSGNQVFEVERNILLGSAYLREMLDHFGGNLALASAAYNAGPHRVHQWLPEDRALSADTWVETIPFYETRHYVQAVLAYMAVYEWKLGIESTPLARRMGSVLPAGRAYAKN